MTDVFEVILRTAISVVAIIAFTRLSGLRSFSKMSEYEFAVTVALGSVLAGMITATDKSLAVGIAALAALFGVQAIIAFTRTRSDIARTAIDNSPLMLFENGSLLHENMQTANVTEADIWGKLREANALDLDRVHAVVLEATGDISVLHGDPDKTLNDVLLKDVRR